MQHVTQVTIHWFAGCLPDAIVFIKLDYIPFPFSLETYRQS